MRPLLFAALALALLPPMGDGVTPNDGPRFRGQELLARKARSLAGNSYFHRIIVHRANGKRRARRVPSRLYESVRLRDVQTDRDLPRGHDVRARDPRVLGEDSIARGGFFEGKRIALEASVKDSKRFRTGWAYFGFENGALASATPNDDSQCHSCHMKHGKIDSVFVQFYPNLRDRM